MYKESFYQRKSPDCGKNFEIKSKKKSIKDLAMSHEDVSRLLYVRAKKEAQNQLSKIASVPSKFKRIATAKLMFVLAEQMLPPSDIGKISSYIEADIIKKLGEDVLHEASNDNLHPIVAREANIKAVN